MKEGRKSDERKDDTAYSVHRGGHRRLKAIHQIIQRQLDVVFLQSHTTAKQS